MALPLCGAASLAQAENLYFNSNYQNVPLVAYPGVTVASMKLPPGEYLMQAKFRYLPNSGGGEATGGCVFQGAAVGGLDGSSARIPLVGSSGQHDGVMMDRAYIYEGGDPIVRVQCWGPSSLHIVNTQFAATPVTIILDP